PRCGLGEALHQGSSPLCLADERQRRYEPEGADEKGALLASQSIVRFFRAVAQYESALAQLVRDCEDGRAEPCIVGQQEPEDGGEERRGVERVGVVMLAKHPALGDAMLEDVGLDLRCAL